MPKHNTTTKQKNKVSLKTSTAAAVKALEISQKSTHLIQKSHKKQNNEMAQQLVNLRNNKAKETGTLLTALITLTIENLQINRQHLESVVQELVGQKAALEAKIKEFEAKEHLRLESLPTLFNRLSVSTDSSTALDTSADVSPHSTSVNDADVSYTADAAPLLTSFMMRSLP